MRLKAKMGSHEFSILSWLCMNIDRTVSNHEMISKIQGYEKDVLQCKIHSTSDISRRFREIRNDPELLIEWGLSIKKVDSDLPYDSWQVSHCRKPVVKTEEMNLFGSI